MQQTDVSAATRATTGTIVPARQRVKGVYMITGETAGSVVFRDGGASGDIRLQLNTPAAVGEIYVPIPDQGVLFQTDVHVTLTNVTSVTVFYA